MSLMNEYINKRMDVLELESELQRLIRRYNSLRKTYLFVYAAAIGKPIPAIPIEQADFYIFHDLLSEQRGRVDVYLETPGGSGETAEEIGKFLHDKFDTVSFVVSGEAKSAGTIIVLSGNEILMTETGSLGPIDAQIKIGRSILSAYDYMEWIEEKRKEAEERRRLNPFDATMIAQISPGELHSVAHALKFAEELVVDWLTHYKFKNWTVTETRKKPVTMDMKKERAEEIAKELINHSKWKSHAKSLKIDDLESIGLTVTKIDDDLELADIVYRIQTICRILFQTTKAYKMFVTQDHKIFRLASQVERSLRTPRMQIPDVVEIKQDCPQCGRNHHIYAKFVADPQMGKDFEKRGFKPFPDNAKIECDCGFEIDLTRIKNQIEMQVQRRII